jgi:anti-anti-sigma factor
MLSQTITADPRLETAPWFSIDVVPAREEARLRAVGELDLVAAPILREHVDELLASGFRELVIDLRRVTFIDLTGVRLLLTLAEDAAGDGWRLSLTQAGEQVRRLLTLTGALDRLPVRDRVADLGHR